MDVEVTNAIKNPSSAFVRLTEARIRVHSESLRLQTNFGYKQQCAKIIKNCRSCQRLDEEYHEGDVVLILDPVSLREIKGTIVKVQRNLG